MTTALPEITTPLPTLMLDAVVAWEWPRPPFASDNLMTPLDGGVQACRIETLNGTAVDGLLIHFDADAQVLRFCDKPDSRSLLLPFAKFRRLTLTTPWPFKRSGPDTPVERVPSLLQERDYVIELAAGGQLTGRTMGQVQRNCGLFLFSPTGDGNAVQRVFVPKAVCGAAHFGKSAEEEAADRWIATPEQLLAALDAQRRAPIKPLGDALVDLGFVTRSILEHAVSEQGPKRELPLGEALVAMGMLDGDDLQTALAHKMGYPLVDLSRFPLDKKAVRKMSQRTMIEHGAVPIMLQGDRLIIAVDNLARIPPLQTLQALADVKVIPVLASRERIKLALAALPQRLGTDCWADNVPLHMQARPTAPGALSAH
jgi:hypothetical protein